MIKVLRHVGGDMPTIGYMYGTMDREKYTIHSYYEDKGEVGYEKQSMIWDYLINSILLIMQHVSTSAPTLLILILMVRL